jgi:hypothetical protein
MIIKRRLKFENKKKFSINDNDDEFFEFDKKFID